MSEILFPMAELAVLMPGLLLAYLPVKQYRKFSARKLAALMAGLALALCAAGGAISYFLRIETRLLFFPVVLAAGIAYVHTLNISRWKSISVYLAVCGVFSCLGGVATALNSVLSTDLTAPWLSMNASGVWLLMAWVFVLVAWYPATHQARELLEDDAFAQTWYAFWALPILFTLLNFFMVPLHPEILDFGRILPLYILISLVLLGLLLLFYAMFYLMASSLNRNDKLRQENQFLSMQQARYDSLKTAIEETRQARHDLRHHFDVLAGFAGRQEWEKLTEYITDARGEIPDADLHLCDNTAVDSVAGHYGVLCQREKIPFSFVLDLPETLPMPEMDVCLVLSNLLENALEASLKTAPARRQIKAQAYLYSENMILLTVENAFDGEIREKDGVFQSSKRRGGGVGIQSVRRTAEKNGGYSRFSYEDGIFLTNVMLRAGQ